MSERNYKHCIRLPYNDDGELDRKLIAVLEKRGYRVERRNPVPLTVGQLSRIYGRPVNGISRSLRARTCPPYDATYGTGTLRRKILGVVMNRELDAFLRK